MSGYGEGGYGGSAGASSFLLFGRNLLESSLVTVTSAAADHPVTRLYDRRRFLSWQATSNAVQNIDLDTVSASYSHIGFVAPSLNTGIEIYRGASYPPATLTATIASLSSDPYIASLGATYGERYLRVRILGGGAVPALGELFAGVPSTLVLPPFLNSAGRSTMFNVQTDLSPSNYRWTVKRGPSLARFAFAWTGMDGTDLAAIETALDDIDDGAKALLIQDELGRAFWVNCVTTQLDPTPVGAGLYALRELAFEEAL